MGFFNKLERKFGRYAIPNLMYYIIILYVMGLIAFMVNPMLYYQYLSLDAAAILHGQIWRLVTFMMYPPVVDSRMFSMLFFNFLALYLYYSLGNSLERVWGSFRFNVYFLMGVLGHILAAFIGYFVFGQRLLLTTDFLNFSLFLAFAMVYPDMQFYVMYILPVKAKWLAIAESAIYVYFFIFGDMATKCEILLSMLNVVLFFLMTRDYRKISPKEIKRKNDFKAQTRIVPKGRTHHKCAVCGRTEADGEAMEFRYCSKCQGNYEYCQDHLYTHKHVTEDGQS